MTEIVASLYDPSNLGGTMSAPLLADLQDAANIVAADLGGNATLTVSLGFESEAGPELADGGPVGYQGITSSGVGVNGLMLGAPFALELLDTGVQGTATSLGYGTDDIDVNDNLANVGDLYLGQDGNVPAGRFSAASMFEHELMHGLAMEGTLDPATGTHTAAFESPYDQWVQISGGAASFTGPEAEAVNGGPVALTTLATGEEYYHFANSHSAQDGEDLMNGVSLPSGTLVGLSVLDLAVLEDSGYTLSAAAQATLDAATPLTTLAGSPVGFQGYDAPADARIVVAQGAASVTGNGAVTSSMTLFSASAVSYANGGGAATVVATGPGSMSLGGGVAGSTLVAFAGADPVTYSGDAGADEVIIGSGALQGVGGSGSLVLFGGTGTLAYASGTGSDTVVGGAGAATIHAGAGGFFAGTGGTQMLAMGPGSFLAGNVSGDTLATSATGGDILAAGAGNETLDGSTAGETDILFGGTGADAVSLGHGADTFIAGAGTATVRAGAGNATLFLGGPGGTGGATLLNLVSGSAGGSETVSGFRVGTDHLRTVSYTRAPIVTAGGDNTTVALSDGSRVTLLGVSLGGTGGLLA